MAPSTADKVSKLVVGVWVALVTVLVAGLFSGDPLAQEPDGNPQSVPLFQFVVLEPVYDEAGILQGMTASEKRLAIPGALAQSPWADVDRADLTRHLQGDETRVRPVGEDELIEIPQLAMIYFRQLPGRHFPLVIDGLTASDFRPDLNDVANLHSTLGVELLEYWIAYGERTAQALMSGPVHRREFEPFFNEFRREHRRLAQYIQLLYDRHNRSRACAFNHGYGCSLGPIPTTPEIGHDTETILHWYGSELHRALGVDPWTLMDEIAATSRPTALGESPAGLIALRFVSRDPSPSLQPPPDRPARLAYGQPFHIEAEFDRPPPDDRQIAQLALRADSGQAPPSEDIVLERTDEPTVFASAPITPEPEADQLSVFERPATPGPLGITPSTDPAPDHVAIDRPDAGSLPVPPGAILIAALNGERAEAQIAPHRRFELVGLDGSRVANTDIPANSAELLGIRPFRLEIDLEEGSPPPTTVVLSWNGGKERLALGPDPDDETWTRWTTPWLMVAGDSMRARDDLDRPIYYNTPEDAEIARTLFAGRWHVVQQGPGGQGHSPGEDDDRSDARGLAVVGEDGLTIDLFLGDLSAISHFRAFEVTAFRTGGAEENDGRLHVRFEDVSQEPDADRRFGRIDDGAWPEYRNIYLPDRTETVTFHVDHDILPVTIGYLEKARDHIAVRLRQTGEDRLSGLWDPEDTVHTDLGRQTWLRDEPRIEGIVVLDDQRESAEYRWPFAAPLEPERHRGAGRHREARTDRTLFVYGHGLPADVDDAVHFHALDDTVRYTLQARGSRSEGDPRFAEGWRRAGIDLPTDLEAVIVRAEFDEGVAPGPKILILNGAAGPWPLEFSNAIGWLGIMRYHRADGSDPESGLADRYGLRALRRPFEPAEAVMPSEIVNIEIDEEVGINIPEIEIAVAVNGTPAGDGTIILRRPEGPASDYPLTSPPIRLVDARSESRRPPDVDGAVSIPVQPGDHLTAEPVSPSVLATVPARLDIPVIDDPGELGLAWADAVDRMAACHADIAATPSRLPAPELNRLLAGEAGSHSRFLLTEDVRPEDSRLRTITRIFNLRAAGRRSITIRRGDQAAAILLSDALATMLTEAVLPYQRASLSNEAAAAFLERGPELLEAGDPFWITLERALARQLLDPERDPDWAIDRLRQAVTEYTHAVNAAAFNARHVDDCDLEALLGIAGRRMDPVVERVLPRLVRRVYQDGRTFWETDLVARSYVRGLYAAGEAVQALEEWASIDSAYQSMALSLVTGGATFGVARAGAYLNMRHAATAGRTVAVGGSAIDMAHFARQSVRNYVVGQDRIDEALGSRAVLGEDVLTEARLAAPSGFWTAIGVLHSASGAFRNVAALRAARSPDTARQGADVLQGVDRLDPGIMAEVTEAVRTQISAFYVALATRQAGLGGEPLSEAERRHFEMLDRYFAMAGRAPDNTFPLRDRTESNGPDPTDNIPALRRVPGFTEEPDPTGESAGNSHNR